MTPHYDIAVEDIASGVKNWHMWGHLGWQEIKRRYRRTVIGPLWTTLSLGLFIGALGVIWSNLWNQDPKIFMPYLCAGMIVWVLISTTINEACTTFIAAENLIKQLRFSYGLLACSVVWRNLIVFFHNMIIWFLVFSYLGFQITWNCLWIVPGLFLFVINGVWLSLLLGLFCSRFRDIQQVISSILNVAVFVTPIIWSAEQIGKRMSIVVDFNIIYHFLNIIRAPLLGQAPELLNWIVVIASSFLGWGITLFFFSRFRWRIPYWI